MSKRNERQYAPFSGIAVAVRSLTDTVATTFVKTPLAEVSLDEVVDERI